MIEVVDEVLEGEPLYRALDKDGNIVLDNIRLEMITPVAQAGTPINKALFDSIKESINTAKENRLVLSVDELNNNFTSHTIDLTQYSHYKKIKIVLECIFTKSSSSTDKEYGIFVKGNIAYGMHSRDDVQTTIGTSTELKIITAVVNSNHRNFAEIEIDFENKIMKIDVKNDEYYNIIFANFSTITSIDLRSREGTGAGYKYNIYAKEEA